MFRILVVEDDANARNLMAAVLNEQGYTVLLAEDGIDALTVFERNHVDLVVLDLMMPRMDGYELARQLRATWADLPILMVTARQEPRDKREGFIAGADDYMTKPVDEEEMVLRIKALLRRSKIAHERCLTVGRTRLDYAELAVTRDDERVVLPQKEFQLLFKLLSYPNTIFTRMQLMEEIWGPGSMTGEHTLNVHINRLRERFRDWEDFEIVTVRGLGYKATEGNGRA